MKKIAGVLPHVIISLYATSLNMAHFAPAGLRAVSLTALILMGGAIWLSRDREGMSPVSKGYLLYFIINVVAYWTLPAGAGRHLTTEPTAFIYGSLAAVTVVPALAAGRYFTEYFARKTTPPAAWETDIFKKINRNMTWMWAGFFVLSIMIALVPSLLSLERGLLTSLVIPMGLPLLLMVGLGVPFNKRYPARYQRKMGIEPTRIMTGSPEATAFRPVGEENRETKKEEVMSDQLRVVAVNGSPHAGVGNTSIMIQMMKPVFAKEGIDLEEICLSEKRIEYCVGCGVCIEKGKCWRQDDHGEIVAKLLAADGVILASPVYFKHVTAQMKTFIDRSLAYGHKPRTTWKPGIAISVSAGMAETATADYLAGLLRTYGAFSVGTLTGIAVGPGSFMGTDVINARAKDLAGDLSRAIKEKRRYPATDGDLFFYLFMGDLVRRQKDFMHDDFRHWEESGLYKGFETYVGQTFANPPYDPEMRKEWVRGMIAEEVEKAKSKAGKLNDKPSTPQSARTCRELLAMMPAGFKKDVAPGLDVVYQFEISGQEEFVAHLRISDGNCVFVDGPHAKPDVTVKSPSDVWLSISKGEMNGQTAFMSGKYRVEGDLTLLMKLGSLFGS
jgi:multimeric flavodoxin WrbA/putative sterol carrier protein